MTIASTGRASMTMHLLSFFFWSAAAMPQLFAVESGGVATTLQSALASPALSHAVIGIDVEDDAGNVLYARNADLLLIPASNRKLFAAATAANCLGFDHHFTTELWLDGRDLILRGGGDPSLGGRYAFDRDAVFAPLVAALRARGIKSI